MALIIPSVSWSFIRVYECLPSIEGYFFMNPLLIISTVWVFSEIILSRMMRAKNSKRDFDKSSLKILWITIAVSITAGILLRRTNFAITDESIALIYYSGITFICLGLIIVLFYNLQL